MHTRSMLRDGLCAACLLALCLAACAPPTLGSRALAQHAGAAAPHTASSVVPLSAYAAAGSLSLPAVDDDAAPGPAAVQGAPGPASAAAPSRAKADKRPPVHRTMDPLTPERRALAFVADNRPAPEEEGDDEGSDSKADDSHDDADAAAPSAGADAHWAVPGTGAPERRDAQVGANPGGRPGHAGGVQTAASVRLRGGAAERDEFAGSPASAPGANTAALIGMGSAFGVLGGGVGASFNFGGGGGNVARGEASTPPLNYHGGSVLTQPVNVYLVMYGTWDASVPTGLSSFINALSGTAWMQINAAYTDSKGGRGTAFMHYGGTCYDTGTKGASLSDADVLAVIMGCLSAGVLPQDASGLYFLISSPEVSQKGFCVDYCGWHDVGPNNMLYGFVGSTLRCPNTCQVQTVGPNGASALDGVASILAHEIAETITDPNTDAWYDSQGEEGADKCAWRYGASWQATNGAKANTVLSNGNSYLLQMNWSPQGGGCTQGFQTARRR